MRASTSGASSKRANIVALTAVRTAVLGVLFALATICGVSAVPVEPAGAAEVASSSNPEPVFRFYKNDGSHFYTANEQEKSQLERRGGGYRYEGIAFYAYVSSPFGDLEPVHRFYNLRDGSHFYTADEDERAAVASKSASTYRYEGVAFYGSTDELAPPVYRFYKFRQGVHFYTVNPSEAENLANRAKDEYLYEGEAFAAPTDLIFSGDGPASTESFILPTDWVTFIAQGADVQASIGGLSPDLFGERIFDGSEFSQVVDYRAAEGRYYFYTQGSGSWTITVRVFDY